MKRSILIKLNKFRRVCHRDKNNKVFLVKQDKYPGSDELQTSTQVLRRKDIKRNMISEKALTNM